LQFFYKEYNNSAANGPISVKFYTVKKNSIATEVTWQTPNFENAR